MDDRDFDRLIETMKRAGAALRDAGIPYMLGGGLAAWARSGARTEHDVDLLLKEEDAERAQQALVEAGMRPERPPEGWLLKAWDEVRERTRESPMAKAFFTLVEELGVAPRAA